MLTYMYYPIYAVHAFYLMKWWMKTGLVKNLVKKVIPIKPRLTTWKIQLMAFEYALDQQVHLTDLFT